MPEPRVYLIDDSAPNAFATGRDPQHASVAVTTGLLEKLDREELQGVIGHELSHVANYDIRFSLLVGVLVGSIALLADMMARDGLLGQHAAAAHGAAAAAAAAARAVIIFFLGLLVAILAPIFARLVQMAVNRQREYLADATSVELTRNPYGLERALAKLAADQEPLEVANRATQHLYVVNPVKKLDNSARGLFSTHPAIVDRINRLRRLTGQPRARRRRREGARRARLSVLAAGARARPSAASVDRPGGSSRRPGSRRASHSPREAHVHDAHRPRPAATQSRSPPVSSMRPSWIGATMTKGMTRPRRPMMAPRPAAAAACSSRPAWSAMRSGHETSMAALAAPAGALATRMLRDVGREREGGHRQVPRIVPAGHRHEGAGPAGQATPDAEGHGRGGRAHEAGQGDLLEAQAEAIDLDHGDERGGAPPCRLPKTSCASVMLRSIGRRRTVGDRLAAP